MASLDRPRINSEITIARDHGSLPLEDSTQAHGAESNTRNIFPEEVTQPSEAIHVAQPRDQSQETAKEALDVKVKPFWKVWVLELVSIVFSFALFVAIVIVLSQFDQRSLPNWPLRITLNTLLAFLSTMAKAAFMLPVSAAISSSQWPWFSHDRPLYDFHRFDQASRGAWGSLLLLWRVQHRHSVSIGAIITIVSTLTSPLTQLAISYPARSVQVMTGDATTGAVHTINGTADDMHAVSSKATVLATALDRTRFTKPILPLGSSCSTGNCTFDTYTSLGICVTQANITSQLRIEEYQSIDQIGVPILEHQNSTYLTPGYKIWKASLPGGYDMVHQTPFSVFTDMLNGNQTFGFKDNPDLVRARVASFVLIHGTPYINMDVSPENKTLNPLTSYTEFGYEASEIIFHLCVQSYHTSVENGVETTQITASSTVPVGQTEGNFLDLNCTSLAQTFLTTCPSNLERFDDILHLEAGSTASNDTLTESYSIDYKSMEDIAKYMKTSLAGIGIASLNPRTFPRPSMLISGSDFMFSIFQVILYSQENSVNLTRRDSALKNLYSNVATSLSNQMRLSQFDTFIRSAFNVSGQAWRQESYVHIDWAWLSFLAVELVLSTLFLSITITAQKPHKKDGMSRFQDIKESSLAALVALGDKCRELAGGGIQPMAELEATAKRLMVRLERNQIVPIEGNIDTQHTPADSGEADGAIQPSED